MQYKHQILTEINRSEVGCAGRSLQKKGKFTLNKGQCAERPPGSKVPVSQPPFSLSPVVMTPLTAFLSEYGLWVPGNRIFSCNLHLLRAAEVLPPLLDPQAVFGGQLQLNWGAPCLCSWTESMHSDPGRALSTCSCKVGELVSNHQELGITSPPVQTPIFRVKPRGC